MIRPLVAVSVSLSLLALPAGAQQVSSAADSVAVVAAVEKFRTSMAAGDSAAALALLADGVQILEAGGVEDLARFRASHLAADIAFARSVPAQHTFVQATVRGDVAWVISTSSVSGQVGGRAVNSQGAELMVLVRTAQGWKIAAVHWSSRRRS